MNTLTIRGEINETTPALVQEQLLHMDPKQPLTVNIDSAGGSVFEGLSIADALKSWPGKTVAVVQNAFSIASLIACACNELHMAPSGFLMVHRPYSQGEGTAADLQSQVVLLNKLENTLLTAYCQRTGKPASEVKGWMDRETFFSADEAVNAGFADRVVNHSASRSGGYSIAAKYNGAASRNWAIAVAGFQSKGMSPSAAATKANRENPGLREQMVAEVNRGRTVTRRSTAPTGAKAKWLAAVKACQSQGMKMDAAMKSVERQYPGLRAEMVEEANR